MALSPRRIKVNRYVSEQFVRVQKELVQKLVEVERIGERLIELGKHLKQDPWGCAIEPEIEDPLNSQRLMFLLDDIRMLRRREAELKKLVAA